jgi:dihydrofolate synthase/folylpolyglutamate synthase
MTDREWLARLEWFGIKLGLDTIGALVAALDHPERAYPVVHVAGTNGKGSVVAMLERVLRASGHRTGRYTSPHLVHLEERFAVDGEPVDPAELDRALSVVRRAVDSRALAHPDLPEPTYFEVTTAAAFEVFRRAAVDVAVVEVGLGGRFDATNVVSPVLSVITSVDFDHEVHLGRTLAAIAAEKAGIIKAGVPVVAGPLGSDALDVVSRTASAAGAPLHLVAEECRVEARSVGDGCREATFHTSRRTYGPVRLALRGDYQVGNAAIAVLAAEHLSDAGVTVHPDAIVTGLADARWPGRLEVITIGDRRITIDGAHNAAGAEALAAYLREAHPDGVPVVFGVMADKAIDAMIEAIAPLARPLVLTNAPGRRAATAEDLASRARRVMPSDLVLAVPDVGGALDIAWRHQRDIVVAGSLYLAGDVIARLDAETKRRRE